MAAALVESVGKLKEQQCLPKHHEHSSNSSSGYCPRTGVYRSLFHPQAPRHRIPTDPNLDIATYIFSQLPPPHVAETKAALVDSSTGQSLTYSRLRSKALSLASVLHHGLGVCKGDVVLLLSPNSVIYPAICLGVLAAGAIITTADPLATTAQVSKQVVDSGATLAISDPSEEHKLKPSGISILMTTRTTTERGEVEMLSVEELMEEGNPTDAPIMAIKQKQSDVAALLYSSGESKGKGVIMTHGNLIAMATLLRWRVEESSSAEDVFLAFLPMSHLYGLAFFVLGLPCVATATTVVMSGRFDLRTMVEAVERHRISNILAVPPVLVAMNKYVTDQAGSRWDLSSLRRVGTGGATMGLQVGEEFRRRFPWVDLREGYGMTEVCGPTTVFVSKEETRNRRGSSGQLMPGFEARVVLLVDNANAAVGPGCIGELWLRGPTITKGKYLGGNQKVTAEMLLQNEEDQGWLRTGDLAYFDQDGFLYIVDRIKDLINHNGYQVAPAELEAILLTHPQILDAAVVPIADEVAGQIPMAYVVRSADNSLTCEEVIQFVAAQVAPYKKITRVAFINVIPRSAAGKMLRKQFVAENQQAISSKL